MALIPYAPSSSAAKTLSCLQRFVVFVFAVTPVFNIVAITLIFAAEPNSVLSVIVIDDVATPVTLSVNEITSPATAVPPPAVRTVHI